MPTYRLTLEYDGEGYSGWQRQPDARTVEGVVRFAIASVCGEPGEMTYASRTDAGAHAHGQVVGLTLGREWQPAKLAAALNAALPEDVVVVDAAPESDLFHARRDAVARNYRYVVVPRRQRSPLTRHQAWLVSGDLDVDAMRRAASLLTGSHDFSAFGRSPQPGGSTRRTVNTVTVRRVAVHGEGGQAPLDAVVIDVSANAFLYGMMRSFAGTLVAIGQGRLTAHGLREMVEAPDGVRARVTVAPARGLHQWAVQYA